MDFTSIIPPEYKIYAKIAALVIALVIAGLVGAKLASWALNAAHATEVAGLHETISTRDGTISDLKLVIKDQNAGVAKLKAEYDAAENARKVSEKQAKRLEEASKGRESAIDDIPGADCGPVLSEYWRLRK